jgi:hypothetical protein
LHIAAFGNALLEIVPLSLSRGVDWLKMKNPAAPAVKREAEEHVIVRFDWRAIVGPWDINAWRSRVVAATGDGSTRADAGHNDGRGHRGVREQGKRDDAGAIEDFKKASPRAWTQSRA